MEVLCTYPGNIYDDSPKKHIIYLKSKIHITDEKNSRIIFVKYKPHLTTDPGYPPFIIVGLDYKGNELFNIDLDEELEPLSIYAYKNGDLLFHGRYNKWLGKNGGNSYDCIIRISVDGSIIWKKIQIPSHNAFDGTYKTWICEEKTDSNNPVNNWERLFLTPDDKILMETVDEDLKSSFALFVSDDEFNAESGGKNLFPQKIYSGSVVQIEETYISIIEERKLSAIRSVFNNEGNKLSEEIINQKHRPIWSDMNNYGVAALFPGYLKYQSFSGIDISFSMDTEDISAIKNEFVNKPIILLLENKGGYDLAMKIKVLTEDGIITILDSNEPGYIQTICIGDNLLCLCNNTLSEGSTLLFV